MDSFLAENKCKSTGMVNFQQLQSWGKWHLHDQGKSSSANAVVTSFLYPTKLSGQVPACEGWGYQFQREPSQHFRPHHKLESGKCQISGISVNYNEEKEKSKREKQSAVTERNDNSNLCNKHGSVA